MCTAQEVLKKHYHNLWKAFPEDYFTSLARLSQLMPLEDRAVNHITNQPSTIGSRMAMLDVVILFKCSDAQLLDICSLMETIIGDEEKAAQVVEPLRIGECIFVCIIITKVQSSWCYRGLSRLYMLISISTIVLFK